MKSSLVLSLLLLATANINARDIKGKVKDAQTGEEIIGASILIKEEPGKGAVSGMDGSFNLSVARPKYTLVCSYVGYKKCEVEIGNKDTEIVIPLKSDDVVLEGVTVIANNPGRTEAGARGIERAAMNRTFSGYHSGKCYSANVWSNNRTKQQRRRSVCHFTRNGQAL